MNSGFKKALATITAMAIMFSVVSAPANDIIGLAGVSTSAAAETTDALNLNYSESADIAVYASAPSAMKGFKLGGRASNALRLNWTKNTSADGYIIEQYKSGKWVRIKKITSNATTTLRVTGLKAGTVYKFRMRAYKMSGSKALYTKYTSTLSARTNPSNVSGFKIGGKASNALRLNWTKNTSADGYIIEQYKSGKWVRIKKITSNATTTLRVTGLKAGTTYKFRMRAYKMSGSKALYSGYTSTLSGKTSTSSTVSAPTNLKQSSCTETSVTVSWSAVSGATKYGVQIYKNGKWVSNNNVTGTKYTFKGLESGTSYKVRVRCYKGNWSSYSSSVTVKCSGVAFKPLVYSGTGDDVITGVDLPAGSYSATLTHTGNSNFIVKLYYGDESYNYQTLSNEIGKYCGTHALHEINGEPLSDGMIQVKADGAWTITINKISGTCTTNIKGKGDTVTGLISVSNARNVIKLTHNGSSNFISKIYQVNGDRYDYETLTNEIGNYSGETIVTLKTDCKYYIYVQADGEWTIDFGLGDKLTTYTNTTPTDSETSTDSNKWSYSEAVDLNTYADDATTYAQEAWGYAIDAIVASPASKVLYNQYAVIYAGGAKNKIKAMKDLADKNAELELTGTNENYSTLQEKIDYVYKLCDEIVNLDITSSNYTTYEEKILNVTQEISMECLGIQKLSIDIVELFA